ECAAFVVLSRDAEAKSSSTGKSYLRINARVGEGDGAQWLNIVSFDAATTEAASSFKKGVRIYIEGTISLNSWTAKDGATRQGLSVVARHCRLSQIGRARSKRSRAAAQTSGGAAPFDDDIPFAPEWR